MRLNRWWILGAALSLLPVLVVADTRDDAATIRWDIPHVTFSPSGNVIAEGGKVYCCRFGLSLHGAREEDLIEGVIPTHPLDVQDALIHYARKGAIINSTYMF